MLKFLKNNFGNILGVITTPITFLSMILFQKIKKYKKKRTNLSAIRLVPQTKDFS